MNPLVSQIKVDGDPNAVDSFAACVRQLRQDKSGHADYWYVEALTGHKLFPHASTTGKIASDGW